MPTILFVCMIFYYTYRFTYVTICHANQYMIFLAGRTSPGLHPSPSERKETKRMKWYQRTMAGVLTAAMGLSMLGGLPMAGAADEPPPLSASTRSAATATGEIQTVIRMDYPISVSKLAASNATLTLYRDEQAIASGALTQNGTLSFSDGSGASGTVTLTTASTRVLSAKVHITGLSAADGSNQYRIKLTGTIVST